jgi:hypothetical protein
MSAELQQVERFPNPITGEMLSLSSPDADLARFIADIRDYETQVRGLKSLVNAELLRRLDERLDGWTAHLEDGITISAPSPEPSDEWDAAGLRGALEELADKGTLPISAVDAAIEVVVSYKPKTAGLKVLRKAGYGELLDRFVRKVEKARYIKVSRS